MSKKEVSFLSANDRFQKSKYEESLKIINTVKTKDYDFYLLRSKIYFSINDFYLSLQDSNQCIKLQENNIEPYEIACKNYINMFDIENENYISIIIKRNKKNRQFNKSKGKRK